MNRCESQKNRGFLNLRSSTNLLLAVMEHVAEVCREGSPNLPIAWAKF